MLPQLFSILILFHNKFIKLEISTKILTFYFLAKKNLIVRQDTKEGSDTNLSDCELLLRKYLDGKYAQLDTLFIVADILNVHENNASKFLANFNIQM